MVPITTCGRKYIVAEVVFISTLMGRAEFTRQVASALFGTAERADTAIAANTKNLFITFLL
jgi:hypothetical protein